MEYRSSINTLAVEMRSSTIGMSGQEIAGIAAVFYDGTERTEFALDPGSPNRRRVVERIMPSAFDAVLVDVSGNDTRGLFNHSSDHLLGRRSAGTLRLSKTPRGLAYAITYDPTDPDHQRVAAKLKRGDLKGSSFGFTVQESGQRFSVENGIGVIEIRSVKYLRDVSPVTFPAYAGTDAGLRSVDAFRHWERSNPDLAAELATLAARAKLAGMSSPPPPELKPSSLGDYHATLAARVKLASM
ncbi:MAG: HK97 family phage prohead protease [Planctomycetes bacterium]|nr:HK97 family phage prohead protease [Planctomycetota bacterium]